jgi:ATP-dependent helicase/nuclease subunit B
VRLTPPATAGLEQYGGWLKDLIGSTGTDLEGRAWAQAETRQRDAAALAELHGLLDNLLLGDRLLGKANPLTFAEFYGELRGAVLAAAYQPWHGAAPAAILAARLSAVRGVTFRAVALLGLAEGQFPATLRDEPFLSDQERLALSEAGLPLEPRLRSDQQSLFYEAVTRATGFLLLTRPYLADDGERWQPSPYWQAALSLFQADERKVRAGQPLALVDAASAVELLSSAMRARALPSAYAGLMPQWEQLRHAAAVLGARQARAASGGFEGVLGDLPQLAARYGPSHVWSASQLETYGACRFRFFVSRVLGLELREPPEAGYDAAQLGGMLHQVLERVYAEAGADAGQADLLAALPEAARRVFDEAPRRFGFRPTAMWQAQQEELIEVLTETISALAAEGGDYRPYLFEAGFGFGDEPPLAVDTPAGRLLVRGVIDRVDLNSAGQLRVIDYKTGISGHAARDLGEGRRLQLGLYALAAERVLGLGPVADGFYWGIWAARASDLRLERFAYPKHDPRHAGPAGAMALARDHAAAFAAGIRAGQFAPQPPAGGCPAYCAARTFCWRYVPADW